MKELIQKAVERAVNSLFERDVLLFSETPHIEVGFPKDDAHGDYTTNIAMVLARLVKKLPLDIANILKENLSSDEALKPFHIEAVAPGYLNFSYTDEALSENVRMILRESGSVRSGRETGSRSGKVLLEFISANPTGPLHLGNARGGFLGDTLARVLARTGREVSTEYYVNDAGEQLTKLGHSVMKDEHAVYGGEYIDDLGRELARRHPELKTAREVGEWAGEEILEHSIKTTLSEKMGVSFDRFVSERHEIVSGGYVDRAIDVLKGRGLVFEQDSALWLKTTACGDDKDRVLVKANGERTYFASDCGYLLHKKERGFENIVEIWGADHHGYVNRFCAAAESLGFARGSVRIILVQMVRLMKDGKEVRMSKRAGTVVSIDELLDRIHVDVARCFFLMYSPDTHMNFDLGLAEERSQKNPVYYMQYAHARMASMLRKAEEDEQCKIQTSNFKITDVFFVHPKEILLIRHLAKFPEVVEEAAETLTAHQLPQYAIRLADCFHSFYDECTVIDTEKMETTRSRLALVRATKTVLAETLRLMGVSAPERM